MSESITFSGLPILYIDARNGQCLLHLGTAPRNIRLSGNFMIHNVTDPRGLIIAKIMCGKRPKEATELDYEYAKAFLGSRAAEIDWPTKKKSKAKKTKVKKEQEPEVERKPDTWDLI